MEVYTKMLSFEDIIEFLQQINYTVVSHLRDKEGEILPSIEITDDGVFVRCQKMIAPEQEEFDTKLAWQLMKEFSGFMSLARLMNAQYTSQVEMLYLTDFNLRKICMTDEELNELEDLNEKYVRFMDSKFKDRGYREDYNSFYGELENESEDDFNSDFEDMFQ